MRNWSHISVETYRARIEHGSNTKNYVTRAHVPAGPPMVIKLAENTTYSWIIPRLMIPDHRGHSIRWGQIGSSFVASSNGISAKHRARTAADGVGETTSKKTKGTNVYIRRRSVFVANFSSVSLACERGRAGYNRARCEGGAALLYSCDDERLTSLRERKKKERGGSGLEEVHALMRGLRTPSDVTNVFILLH